MPLRSAILMPENIKVRGRRKGISPRIVSEGVIQIRRKVRKSHAMTDRFPIPCTSPAEGIVKGYDDGLKREPMFVSKVIKGSF